jgi:hypothetical protein
MVLKDQSRSATPQVFASAEPTFQPPVVSSRQLRRRSALEWAKMLAQNLHPIPLQILNMKIGS